MSTLSILNFIGKRCLKPAVNVSQIRHVSHQNREECVPKKQEDCQKIKMKMTVCDNVEVRRPKMHAEPKPPFRSMWENPLCNTDPCPDPPPKFDSIYYQASDKFCRKYQQTWNECPPRRIVQRILCEFPKEKMPPMEKRPRKCRPPTARIVTEESSALMECKKKMNARCPKVCAPGCRKVRANLKCHVERGPSDCKKIKCPYPSFTECRKAPFNKQRPNECACIRIKSQCEEYLLYLKKKAMSVRK